MTAGVTQIQASLAQARDAQLSRVVAMVDAVPDRGELDELIAPLRSRLAQIRPVRPLTFTRLLFTPLNAIIVSGSEWPRCGVGVPRQALAALGTAVRAELPHYAAWNGNWERLGRDGRTIWPQAATILDRLPTVVDWNANTGLATKDFGVVTATIAAILHEAAAIEDLVLARQEAEDVGIRAILSRSKARGAVALDTVVAVLLARLPFPARVAALAEEAAGSDGVTGRAIDRLATSVSKGTGDRADVCEAATEASRVAALLGALETGASPERRARLDLIRRDADSLSRRCFTHAADQILCLAEATMTAGSEDAAICTMETSARDLRRLESAARKLGSGEHYDEILAKTAGALCNLPGSLGLADQVRLVEILAGSDQAVALLKQLTL